MLKRCVVSAFILSLSCFLIPFLSNAQIGIEVGRRTGFTFSKNANENNLNAAFFQPTSSQANETYLNISFRTDSSWNYRVGVSALGLGVSYTMAGDYQGSHHSRGSITTVGKTYVGLNFGVAKNMALLKRFTASLSADYQLLYAPSSPEAILFGSKMIDEMNQRMDTLIITNNTYSNRGSAAFNHRVRLGLAILYKLHSRWDLGINAGLDLGFLNQKPEDIEYFLTSSPQVRYRSAITTTHTGFNAGLSLRYKIS